MSVRSVRFLANTKLARVILRIHVNFYYARSKVLPNHVYVPCDECYELVEEPSYAEFTVESCTSGQ